NSDQRKAHRLRAGRGAAATRGRADRLRARRAALVPDNRVRDAHSSGLKGLKTSAQLSLVWYSNTQSVGGPRLLSRSRLVGLFGSISVVVALALPAGASAHPAGRLVVDEILMPAHATAIRAGDGIAPPPCVDKAHNSEGGHQ